MEAKISQAKVDNWNFTVLIQDSCRIIPLKSSRYLDTADNTEKILCQNNKIENNQMIKCVLKFHAKILRGNVWGSQFRPELYLGGYYIETHVAKY